MTGIDAETRRLEVLGVVLQGNGNMDLNTKNEAALRLMKAADTSQIITFAEFRTLMEARRYNVDSLVDLFRGKIEDPRDFFERVMSCKWRNPDTRRFEDRSGVAIPYRSVIEFYNQELQFFKDTAKPRQRLCQCGCGKPVFGQYKFSSDACRKRAQRRKSDVTAEGVVSEGAISPSS